MIDFATNTLNALQNLGFELLVVGALFFLIEKIRPAEKKTPFFKSDFWQELGLAVLNISILSPLFLALIAASVSVTLHKILPFQILDPYISALPITIQILIACLILDFSTYWRHRITHTIPLLWSFHSVHHAAKGLNWLTSMRLHPIDLLVALIFDVFILHLFGFSGEGIALGVFVIHLYNYFTHTNLNLQFRKPFRYIFASPNFHRWHHATAHEAHNKNFCAMFSLLDIMFGSYHHPEELPEGYGLEPQDQKEYPKGLLGWIVYPFKQITNNTRQK